MFERRFGSRPFIAEIHFATLFVALFLARSSMNLPEPLPFSMTAIQSPVLESMIYNLRHKYAGAALDEAKNRASWKHKPVGTLRQWETLLDLCRAARDNDEHPEDAARFEQQMPFQKNFLAALADCALGERNWRLPSNVNAECGFKILMAAMAPQHEHPRYPDVMRHLAWRLAELGTDWAIPALGEIDRAAGHLLAADQKVSALSAWAAARGYVENELAPAEKTMGRRLVDQLEKMGWASPDIYPGIVLMRVKDALPTQTGVAIAVSILLERMGVEACAVKEWRAMQSSAERRKSKASPDTAGLWDDVAERAKASADTLLLRAVVNRSVKKASEKKARVSKKGIVETLTLAGKIEGQPVAKASGGDEAETPRAKRRL